ncbi:MAG: DUF2927 domain-containing protein [Rhodobacteraceae bacterium]|jgi:hypothetical protein|nr:DUF2927 domain-containing protein [Paracoccaceae bacterium]
MTPDADTIAALFTRSDGRYLFARWGRPIAPVAFGVNDATLGTLKDALAAVCQLAGHPMADLDPELGANLMFFFVQDWQELLDVPNFDRLIDGLAGLVARLQAAGANQYRVFRFDEGGAIKVCFVFVRMDGDLEAIPAADLALHEAAQAMLLWSDTAFATRTVLARAPSGATVLAPDLGPVLRAAYDPVLPAFADDPAHALRVAARVGRAQ